MLVVAHIPALLSTAYEMSGQECVAFNSNNNVPAGRTGTELDRQQECLD